MDSFLSAVIKTTKRCNLSCDYCYDKDGEIEDRPIEEHIDKLMGEILSTDFENIYFTWHGGEPLLKPISFYENIAKIQRRFPNKKIRNGIQSNLTLLTADALLYLKELGFGIATSLDGPEELTDINRHGLGVESVFDTIKKEIESMQLLDIRPKAVCVISQTNLNHIRRLYEFFESMKIDITVTPLIPNERYPKLNITPQEYGRALIELFDLWYGNEESNIKIIPFNHIMNGLLFGQSEYCMFSENCLNYYVNISPNGDIFPTCSKLNDSSFRIGNLKYDSITTLDIRKALERAKMLRADSIKRYCQDCEYYFFCRGGCPAQHTNFSILEKDHFCISNRMIFDHISHILRQ